MTCSVRQWAAGRGAQVQRGGPVRLLRPGLDPNAVHRPHLLTGGIPSSVRIPRSRHAVPWLQCRGGRRKGPSGPYQGGTDRPIPPERGGRASCAAELMTPPAVLLQPAASHLNHRISKEIVSVAQRTGRGIAVEGLDGIRDRVRLRRDQRGTLSSWPFHQLGSSAGTSPTKRDRPGWPPWKWTRAIPRSAARAATTPRRPNDSGPPLLSSVRSRSPRRRRRRGERARPRTLGVGICHHARPHPHVTTHG